jgi:hypothetical protein
VDITPEETMKAKRAFRPEFFSRLESRDVPSVVVMPTVHAPVFPTVVVHPISVAHPVNHSIVRTVSPIVNASPAVPYARILTHTNSLSTDPLVREGIASYSFQGYYMTLSHF